MPRRCETLEGITEILGQATYAQHPARLLTGQQPDQAKPGLVTERSTKANQFDAAIQSRLHTWVLAMASGSFRHVAQ